MDPAPTTWPVFRNRSNFHGGEGEFASLTSSAPGEARTIPPPPPPVAPRRSLLSVGTKVSDPTVVSRCSWIYSPGTKGNEQRGVSGERRVWTTVSLSGFSPQSCRSWKGMVHQRNLKHDRPTAKRTQPRAGSFYRVTLTVEEHQKTINQLVFAWAHWRSGTSKGIDEEVDCTRLPGGS